MPTPALLALNRVLGALKDSVGPLLSLAVEKALDEI